MAKGGPWDKKKRLRSTKLKAPGNPALKVEAESNPREELELCVHVGVGVGCLLYTSDAADETSTV